MDVSHVWLHNEHCVVVRIRASATYGSPHDEINLEWGGSSSGESGGKDTTEYGVMGT